ncbi:MAG: hypothetical protein ABR518_09075 [Actinomycetota bacterium]
MCRALKVLCAASSPDRLAELKRATVSAHWELVGGAVSVETVGQQVELHRPDVVVVDASLGAGAVDAVRRACDARVICVGDLRGADAIAASLDDVRDAILGVPRAGGPVKR